MIWVFIIVIGAVIIITALIGGMGYFGSPPSERRQRSTTSKFIDWMM